jgi:hypothetical protein
MELQFSLGRRLRLSVGSMAMMSALAACGGGGGGGDNTPPDNPGDNAVTANDDTFASIGSSSGGSTAAVQANDTVRVGGSATAAVLNTNASIVSATRTSAAPAAGSVTFNTTSGVITVAAGTSGGSYVFTYRMCLTAPNQTVCDDATVTVPVGTTAPGSNIANRADILACPASSSLISSSNWSSCLAGKRLVGNDPIITSQTCQVLYLADGGVEYTHNGVVYLPSVNGPAKGGLYQNTTSGSGIKLMFGNLDWDLLGSSARNRVTDVDLSIFILPDTQDLVEVTYFDSALTRRTLNCNLTNL